MPEAFVSVMAAVMGNPGLALGNGVGSIITDTGLIFGITVLITSTQMNKWILSRTGWWQIGSAGLLVVFALISSAVHPGTPVISRWMGAVFVLLLIVYLWKNYNWARNKESHGKDEVSEVSTEKAVSPFQIFILLLGGLFFVIIASRLLIPAAGEIALRLNVPDDVIAATMVAFGTSLPELVTAIAAIKKGHPEIYNRQHNRCGCSQCTLRHRVGLICYTSCHTGDFLQNSFSHHDTHPPIFQAIHWDE